MSAEIQNKALLCQLTRPLCLRPPFEMSNGAEDGRLERMSRTHASALSSTSLGISDCNWSHRTVKQIKRQEKMIEGEEDLTVLDNGEAAESSLDPSPQAPPPLQFLMMMM